MLHKFGNRPFGEYCNGLVQMWIYAGKATTSESTRFEFLNSLKKNKISIAVIEVWKNFISLS